jgi:hypothetical protein
MRKVRERLSYANVVATLALFIALGGGAYAATVKHNSVTTKSVKNGSLKGVDVKDNNLTSKDVDESTLRLTCPSDTLLAGGTCIEKTTRAAQGLDGAMGVCAAAGRRLPTPAEYDALTALPGIVLDGNGEQTTVYGAGDTNVIAVEIGVSISNSQAFPRLFRCATSPGVG